MSARESSALEAALRLVAAGKPPFAAANKVGIAPCTIYKALKRRRLAAPPGLTVRQLAKRGAVEPQS